MSDLSERRLLQIFIAILGVVPVGGGLAGVLFGPGIAGFASAETSFDSHFRYLSGLLLAIGLAFWSTIPHIQTRTQRFRMLTAIVFVGGLARLFAAALIGWPSAIMTGAFLMELVVTPLLCAWQTRVAKTSGSWNRMRTK